MCLRVLLPYRFTLFSNLSRWQAYAYLFYYLIDLHYSQTTFVNAVKRAWFYYLIDLHYSQTTLVKIYDFHLFYYLIDLHYSQTSIE